MSQAYVVIDEPCPNCIDGDSFKVKPAVSSGTYAFVQSKCATCHGTGTVQRRVTCAECKSFSVDEEFAFKPFCIKFGNPVSPTFGCALWRSSHD